MYNVFMIHSLFLFRIFDVQKSDWKAEKINKMDRKKNYQKLQQELELEEKLKVWFSIPSHKYWY